MFSWDTKNSSARQEILRVLKNRKFSAIQKCPKHIPNLSQFNPVYSLQSRFFQTHFNSVLSFTPRSSKWSPSFRDSHHTPLRTQLLFHIGKSPSHPFLLNLIRLIATLRDFDFFIPTSEQRNYADTISVKILTYSHVFLSKFLRETPQLPAGWRKELRSPT